MDATVPAVEVADDADALRAGGPNGEVDALNAFESDKVRPEFLVGVVMAALAHQVEVKLREDAGESVGVVNLERLAVVGMAMDFVTGGREAVGLLQRQDCFKKTFVA